MEINFFAKLLTI